MKARQKRAPASVGEPKRFVVLPENRAALLAVRRLVTSVRLSRPARFPLLYLHGRPGTGKSRLLRELLDRVVEAAPSLTVRLIAARDLEHTVTVDAAADFLDCDLLLIEDVQHLPVSAARDLERLLDQRAARRRWQVVTATAGPVMLDHLPRRLVSRLGAGLTVRLQPLKGPSRRRIARTLCRDNDIEATRDVIAWLARPAAGGVRGMIGDLHLIQRLTEDGRPVDRAGLTALAESSGKDATLDRLVQRVAEHFGVTVAQMRKRDRRRRTLWPRQVAMYLARRVAGCSLPRIGAFFGGYDHTTVLNACKTVERRTGETVGLAEELAELGELSA